MASNLFRGLREPVKVEEGIDDIAYRFQLDFSIRPPN